MIVINFKTYPQSTGEKAVALAKVCQEVAEKSKVKVVIGLQAADIYRVSSLVKVPIFAQHLDPLEPGRNTGWTMASSLREAGAAGVFLNHSEHAFANLSDLEKAIRLAKDEGLESLVFSKDLETSMVIDKFNPDYIALEEPSLVAGETPMTEVSRFRPMIKEFSRAIKSFPLIGAGVKTKEDVIESLKLGVKGVAFASGFVKAEDPKAVLLSFASVFNQ